MQYKNIILALLLSASSFIVSAAASRSVPSKNNATRNNSALDQPNGVGANNKSENNQYHAENSQAMRESTIETLTTTVNSSNGPPSERPSETASETHSKCPATVASVMEYYDNETKKLDIESLMQNVDLDDEQFNALSQPNLIITEEVVKAILKLSVKQSNGIETPSETPAKLPATFEYIKEYFDPATGKLMNADALNNGITLTEAQFNALKAEGVEIKKKEDLDGIFKALESKSAEDPAVKDKKVPNKLKNFLRNKMRERRKSAAVTETDELKVKDLFALVQDGEIKDLSQKMIDKHKLTPAQVNALKGATDLTEEKIKKILGEKSGKKGSDVKSSNASADVEKNDNEKWYTSTWFIILSSVVVLSALGGGVYMMTNKSDETDL